MAKSPSYSSLVRPINFASMPNFNHEDNQLAIVDLVDNSVISMPNTVEVARALQLGRAGRAGLTSQLQDFSHNGLPMGVRQLAKISVDGFFVA